MSDTDLKKLFDETAPQADPAALHRLRVAAEEIPARRPMWRAWLRPRVALPVAAAAALALFLVVGRGPEPAPHSPEAPVRVATTTATEIDLNGFFDLSLDPDAYDEDLLEYRLDLDDPEDAADHEAWVAAYDTLLASNGDWLQ